METSEVSETSQRGAAVGGPAFLEVDVREVAWDDADAVALRAGQRAEIAEMYGTPDSEAGQPPSADDVAVFLVAYGPDGTPLGCGGLRRLDGATGEVKRMYVTPGARGTGAAGAILRALEDWARRSGWSALRLETGDRQLAAVRFYTRAGYARIPNFGPYEHVPDSLCFERAL
ncbi:GNAT family N-acetyltransferase [Streptomyces sp. NPDC047315]|uniref:GNAT family N-acetyltransferase n=1 Tax=Streptomyces sp. NPDC047315 TaxID=3155142 RepID=UPI0033DAE793